jgi:hypothetical protein
LKYRADFTLYFELLSSNNEYNVPRIEDKEGGLIRLFLNKIPHKFGKNLWLSCQSQCSSSTNSMEYFFDVFYEAVEQAHDDAKSANNLKEVLSERYVGASSNNVYSSPTGNYQPRKSSYTSATRQSFFDNSRKSSILPNPNRSESKFGRKPPGSLHAMDCTGENFYGSLDSTEEDIDRIIANETYYSEEETGLPDQPSTESSDGEEKYQLPYGDDVHSDADQQLAVIDNSARSTSTSLVA